VNDFVLSLDLVRQHHADHVGGKAAVLGTLLEVGFPVPPGLCVTTTAFHAALTPFRPQIHELLGQLDLHQPKIGEQATTAAAKIAVQRMGSP
jgi:rifampicin phosphotransferase